MGGGGAVKADSALGSGGTGGGRSKLVLDVGIADAERLGGAPAAGPTEDSGRGGGPPNGGGFGPPF